MEQYLLFPALLVGSMLTLGSLCRAQGPENIVNNGLCDTLYVEFHFEKEVI
jgi:hypothetical protein